MVRIIGHRGAAGEEPENTLRSFSKAVELGADMVELDIRICASGELVVIHDETVDRTTNGSGRVNDLDFSKLRKLDAGSGEMIPTLDEVIELIDGCLGLDIELKDPGTAEQVRKILDKANDEGIIDGENIIVSSFDPSILLDFKGRDGFYKMGVLVQNNPWGAEEFGSMISAFSVHPEFEFLTEEFVSRSHRMDLKVIPWTVNEIGDIRRMVGMGCDGIVTDYPGRVREILGS